jgi:hypothetical protein
MAMKKRSAMAIAAGLVAALLTGAVALSMGLSGTPTADATGERVKPLVRTVHETVTVHREAKAEEPQTVTIVAASASSPASSESSDVETSDDESEDEDEGFEVGEDSEDHEDEDSEEEDD